MKFNNCFPKSVKEVNSTKGEDWNFLNQNIIKSPIIFMKFRELKPLYIFISDQIKNNFEGTISAIFRDIIIDELQTKQEKGFQELTAINLPVIVKSESEECKVLESIDSISKIGLKTKDILSDKIEEIQLEWTLKMSHYLLNDYKSLMNKLIKDLINVKLSFAPPKEQNRAAQKVFNDQ